MLAAQGDWEHASRYACERFMQTILRIVVTVLLATLAGATNAASSPQEPDPERVILSLATPGLSEPARRIFTQNLLRGLVFGGHEVDAEDSNGPSAATELLAMCADAACVRRIGQLRGAGYLVKASVDAMPGSNAKMTYHLRMEAFAANTGQPITEKHTACDACDENLAAHLGYLLATEIGRGIADVHRQRDVPAPTVGATPPLAGPRPAATTSHVLSAPTVPEEQHRSSARAALPWMAIGAGVLALATSVVLIVKDGKGTCALSATDRQCPDVYDTKTQGILWGAGGVALVGLGLWDLASAKNEPAPLHARLHLRADLGLAPGLGALVVHGAF
jgi:hypothetical protein